VLRCDQREDRPHVQAFGLQVSDGLNVEQQNAAQCAAFFFWGLKKAQ
jgi:hypothetical protein